MPTGLFGDLLVIDCASFIAGPAAATVMSDYGARVIKIEPPGIGDAYRNLFRLRGTPDDVDYSVASSPGRSGGSFIHRYPSAALSKPKS